MSTLAEIEEAIATLPAPEQRELLRHLGARFGRERGGRDEGGGAARRSARGFPIVAGCRPITPDDVARSDAEA